MFKKIKKEETPVTHKNSLKEVQNIANSLDLIDVWRVTKADILAGYKTDHSLIALHLANNNNPRGPGFWKLNTSFLSDSEYMNVIKKTIAEVANEYNNNNEVDPVLLWDTIKMRIRSSSLKYAKEKKAKMKSKETNLECDILSLQKKLEEKNLSETDKTLALNELEVKTPQLEKICQHQTRGIIVRSKGWFSLATESESES